MRSMVVWSWLGLGGLAVGLAASSFIGNALHSDATIRASANGRGRISSMTVTGRNYTAGLTVSIVGRGPAAYLYSMQATAQSNGSFVAHFTRDGGMPNGRYTIRAQGADGRSSVVSGVFVAAANLPVTVPTRVAKPSVTQLPHATALPRPTPTPIRRHRSRQPGASKEIAIGWNYPKQPTKTLYAKDTRPVATPTLTPRPTEAPTSTPRPQRHQSQPTSTSMPRPTDTAQPVYIQPTPVYVRPTPTPGPVTRRPTPRPHPVTRRPTPVHPPIRVKPTKKLPHPLRHSHHPRPATSTPVATFVPTLTMFPTASPTTAHTATPVPSNTPTNTPTNTATSTPSPTPTGISIFGSEAPTVPQGNAFGTETYGLKFRSSVSGYITAIRYYREANEGGSHSGYLWTAGASQPFATVAFSNETSSGWQIAQLSSPILIAASTTYVVGVNSNYNVATHPNELNNSVSNGPLSTVADGANGVYSAGSGGAVPSFSSQSTNYFVDVMFRQ